jgi:hypothetical protein
MEMDPEPQVTATSYLSAMLDQERLDVLVSASVRWPLAERRKLSMLSHIGSAVGVWRVR